MKKDSRQAYLHEVWSKGSYPPATLSRQSLDNLPPEGSFLTQGRVVLLASDSLTLFSNGRSRQFEFNPSLELAQGYALSDTLRAGDIVEVLGLRKQDTLEIQGLTLLVPTKRDNPFLEISFDQARALQWQKLLKALRSFFQDENFIEIRTPTLVASPGLEPHLEPFETQFYQGTREIPFFLPTSPEFHLKKTLTLGYERCFELKECFRNNELSEHHQPEFLMLEWYRAFQDNHSLIRDLRDLLKLTQKLFPETNPQVHELEVVTMPQLWKDILQFDLNPRTNRSQLMNLARTLEVEYGTEDTFDDLFARIFLEKVEPALALRSGPVVVWYYPPSQAALARLTPEGWADRFELYWRGLEIANAFHELNDVEEQRRRFAEDQKKKASLGRPIVPIDEEFMAALEWGLPPSVGIALGVERLFMALLNLKNLDEVRLFPVRRGT